MVSQETTQLHNDENDCLSLRDSGRAEPHHTYEFVC